MQERILSIIAKAKADESTRLEIIDGFADEPHGLPSEIGELTNLVSLDLSGCHFVKLPPEIGNLKNLRFLNLDYNKLSELPPEIGQLENLRSILLGSNRLVTLPKEIGQLKNLALLNIELNRITELPVEVGDLERLEELSLMGNQLKVFPKGITNLCNLQGLNLSSNSLTEIPETIGRLTNLVSFYIDQNLITSLPPEIGNLQNLRTLNAQHNRIDKLPIQLKKLKKLKKLYLGGNQGLDIPAEILENPPEAILNYLFEDKKPLNEAKLILVGNGGVGKTSLVNRLINNNFDANEHKTDGIRITDWQLKLNNSEEVHLNVWDFGGQEIMHATHQFFMMRRSLYLLVLNGRQGHEDADADYWLRLIESFGGNSPVIIVLNKIDEHFFDLNRQRLIKKYPFIKGFLTTDCKTNNGIETLKEKIKSETNQLEELRKGFPKIWFEIKDRIANMPENYISFDKYRELCRENGEEGSSEQEELAGFLNDLGIAINYSNDPRLRDTHILNPRWVTNGIYKILNSEIVAQQKGVLEVNDLARILDAVDYPAEKHAFIIELMRKFELCFMFPDEPNRYLIPELLDKQEPEEASEFKPEECLNFQYKYPVLPEGLISRFIVSTHTVSKKTPKWKNGVILEFEKNKALIQADIQEKKISIFVKGQPNSRRRLLAIIRSNFEKIHESFAFNPEALVPLPDYPDITVTYKELETFERNNRTNISIAIKDTVKDFNVKALLEGVDINKHSASKLPSKKIRLFYSYSHKDEALRDELETHLTLLKRSGLIESWHDRRITAGTEWEGEIDKNLEQADIILLLISSDFVYSDYCYDVEMKRATERHEAGDVKAILVILRPVSLKNAPFMKWQALPKDAVPVTTWENRDEAWKNVADSITDVVNQILETRQ